MISTADVNAVASTVDALADALRECDQLIVYARRKAADGTQGRWRDRITQLRTIRASLDRDLTTLEQMFH